MKGPLQYSTKFSALIPAKEIRQDTYLVPVGFIVGVRLQGRASTDWSLHFFEKRPDADAYYGAFAQGTAKFISPCYIDL